MPIFNQKSKITFLSYGMLIAIFVFALVFGGGFVMLLHAFVQMSSTYPDFIVGASTWDSASKFQDVASYPIFITGCLIGGGAGWKLSQQISRYQNEYKHSLITSLIWWLVPVAIGIGGSISIYPKDYVFAIAVGIAGAIVTIVGALLNKNRGAEIPEILGLGSVTCFLMGLLPFSITVALDRLGLSTQFGKYDAIFIVSGLFFIISALRMFYLCRFENHRLRVYVRKLLVFSQLGISPLYFLILPNLYHSGHNTPVIKISPTLWVLSMGLVIASIFDVVVRQNKWGNLSQINLERFLSPITIFSTVLLLKHGQTVVPHIPTDDYHFGESLLGWWSFWEFGKVPYIDFFSPHGFLGDDIGGYLSLVFYDGSAATMAEAERLSAVIALFFAFVALKRYTGSIGLAYISILLFGIISRKLFFLFLAPFICVWLKQGAIYTTRRWLWVWIITAPALVLAIPPQGLLLVISTLPIVFLRIYNARTLNWRNDVIVISILIGLLSTFTPLLAMLNGAVGYVIDNGPINQLSYGIPWSWSWESFGQGKEKVIFSAILEILRMSWVLVSLAAAALIICKFRNSSYRDYLVGVALPIFLFISFLTPYTMGRIDPSVPSRPGLVSNLAFTVLLPILLAPLLAKRGMAVLAVGIAFVCSGIGLVDFNRSNFKAMVARNQVADLWSGYEHDLRNMGTGLVNVDHVERLIRINDFLSKHLGPRETYLDLTGRNAHYMYFDRPPAMAITAPYNLVPLAQQRKAIAHLTSDLPKIALLEADNLNFDGGGLALRSHLLYRFVVEHYTAELHDGYVYGINKNDLGRSIAVTFAVKDLTDENWLHGVGRNQSALVIRDAKTIRFLRVDDAIRLPNHQVRKIVRIWPEGNAIWLDGGPIASDLFLQNSRIHLLTNENSRDTISKALMNDVFSLPELRKLPVAWGMSSRSLEHVMTSVVGLNVQDGGLHDLRAVGNLLDITGTDPYWWIDLSGHKINGRSAGLLKFDFICDGYDSPIIQIFWWGDTMQGATAEMSMRFTATNGSLIVPLDVYPSWLQLNDVKGLRIDLDSIAACKSISIKNGSLNQRTNI